MAQNAQVQQQQLGTENERDSAIREREELRCVHEQLLRDHERLAALHERQEMEYEALMGKHGCLKNTHRTLELEHRTLQERYGTEDAAAIRAIACEIVGSCGVSVGTMACCNSGPSWRTWREP